MNKKVLVIDDDNMFRTIMARNLTKLGFEVIENATGIGVKEQVQAETPVVCLLDMMLDDQDSKAVLLELKSLPSPPKVVAVSANSDYLDEIKEIGVDATLCKPITPVMLADIFSRLDISHSSA